MVAFTPVVEPNLPGAFITKHPRDTLAENSEKLPFLTGLTYDEGLIKSPRKTTFLSLYFQWNAQLAYTVKRNICYLLKKLI